MKIALLTNGIWPYVIGGMQKHSYFLCKSFAKQKTEVVLVHTASRITDEVRELDCFSPEEKKYIRSIVVEMPKVKPFPGHYIYQSYLYSKEVFNAIRDEEGIDFILAKGMAGWYTLAGNRRPATVAVNIHGYEFLQKKADFKMRLEALMLRYPLTHVNRKADYVFSYGGKITSYIKSLGVPSERIIEVPGGIEKEWMVEKPEPLPGKRIFVFIGRFERRKGMEELNRAISILKAEGLPFDFQFIGPVPEEKKIRGEGIRYHGVLKDKSSIQRILQSAHALVCPSYAEGMPNVILEGMANGCAIIATDVGATSLLVNEEVGWLILPADDTGLQGALREAIAIPEQELMRKRTNAVDKIRQSFTWDQVGKTTLEAIQNISGK